MTKSPRAFLQDSPLIPRSFSKQRALWNFLRKASIRYAIEIKGFSSMAGARGAVRGEFKCEGTSHDVHENKYRKNVTSLLSRDLDENIGGYSSYPTMFLKRNGVSKFWQELIHPRKSPERFEAGVPGGVGREESAVIDD